MMARLARLITGLPPLLQRPDPPPSPTEPAWEFNARARAALALAREEARK